MKQRLILALLSLSLTASTVVAEHTIDVQRFVQKGEYLSALSAFEKMPKRRRNAEAFIAAARAAWALSQPDKARELFGLALRDAQLSEVERARIELALGIIALQEEEYPVALLHAKRVVELLPAGPLRAQAWMLMGESNEAEAVYGKARQAYTHALAEGSEELLPSVHFALGRCSIKLGDPRTAEEHLSAIPTHHALSVDAIRALGVVAIESGDTTRAATWLTHGRTTAPDDFIDSWTDYALVRAAAAKGDAAQVAELRRAAASRLPPSDPWFTLLEAEAESFAWRDVVEPITTEKEDASVRR